MFFLEEICINFERTWNTRNLQRGQSEFGIIQHMTNLMLSFSLFPIFLAYLSRSIGYLHVRNLSVLLLMKFFNDNAISSEMLFARALIIHYQTAEAEIIDKMENLGDCEVWRFVTSSCDNNFCLVKNTFNFLKNEKFQIHVVNIRQLVIQATSQTIKADNDNTGLLVFNDRLERREASEGGESNWPLSSFPLKHESSCEIKGLLFEYCFLNGKSPRYTPILPCQREFWKS